MKKGDVPVPYIVSLILAAIIIGIIGYWFFTTVLSGSKTATEKYCQALAIEKCLTSPSLTSVPLDDSRCTYKSSWPCLGKEQSSTTSPKQTGK